MTVEPEPLIFTPEFIQSLSASGAAFERQEIVRIAKLPAAAAFRRRLEDAIRCWPSDKRGPLIGRIQSIAATESWSAISELLVYDHLCKEFADVQVEPSLHELGGKTPDFVVSACGLVVEVATVFEQANVPAQLIIETLNGISSETKIMNLAIHCPAEVKNPRLAEIRRQVGRLLASYSGATPLQPFQFKASDGSILTGLLYRGSPEHAVVGGIVGRYLAYSGEPGYVTAIRNNALTNKARKYRAVSRSLNMPLVVALYCRNDELDEIDFAEILFGDEEFSEDVSGAYRMTRRNPFFRADRNRSISAVLIRSAPIEPKWILVMNPFARVKLGSLQANIERAFSAQTVSSAKALAAGFQ